VTFFIDNWMLFLVALSSGGMLLWPVLAKGGGTAGISPTEAVQLMNREKAVVVDVCSAEEFASGHVVSAKNIPLGELEAKLSAAVKNKQNPLVLVCASGARSGRAVGVAKKLGYEKVFSMTGGMGAWRSAGLPVHKN
jgi:rhodanese-related sulfurtransferase